MEFCKTYQTKHMKHKGQGEQMWALWREDKTGSNKMQKLSYFNFDSFLEREIEMDIKMPFMYNL